MKLMEVDTGAPQPRINQNVIDRLASESRASILKRLEEKKRERDERLVSRYVSEKFPYARLGEVSPKEFKGLVKRAENFYLRRFGLSAAWALSSLSGLVYLTSLCITLSPNTVLYWLGLLPAWVGMVSSSVCSLFLTKFSFFDVIWILRKGRRISRYN